MSENSESAPEALDDAFELDLDTPTTLDEALEDAVAATEASEAAEGEDDAEDDRVAVLERALAEAQERQMRTLADFENFRKRTEREKRDLRRYAVMDPLRSFLEVMDNVHRAMGASGSAEDLKLGLDLTVRSLEKMLAKLGIEEVPSVGAAFDPTVHEAVSREESADISEPTVVAEMQKGYTLHDRLLRPAMVSVAMPAPGASPTVDNA